MIKHTNTITQIQKKIDTIKFLDYKKWHKENKVVWNSIDYGKAQFKLRYHDENKIEKMFPQANQISC